MAVMRDDNLCTEQRSTIAAMMSNGLTIGLDFVNVFHGGAIGRRCSRHRTTMATESPGDVASANYFCMQCVFDLHVLFSTDNGLVPYKEVGR